MYKVFVRKSLVPSARRTFTLTWSTSFVFMFFFCFQFLTVLFFFNKYYVYVSFFQVSFGDFLTVRKKARNTCKFVLIWLALSGAIYSQIALILRLFESFLSPYAQRFKGIIYSIYTKVPSKIAYQHTCTHHWDICQGNFKPLTCSCDVCAASFLSIHRFCVQQLGRMGDSEIAQGASNQIWGEFQILTDR